MPQFLGVDPGASGGFAEVMDNDGLSPEVADTSSMKSTDRDILDWLAGTSVSFAVLEKVSGYAGQGQPGSAMFKFGANYGALRMALTAAKIPFEEATPQRWQKALGIPPRSKKESKTQWKNRLKAFAQKLFPNATVTLAVADAILIAEYARRLRTGSTE